MRTEIIMTDKATLRALHPSGWQLLDEFASASPGGSDSDLMAQVTSSMETLRLQPLQRERIHRAVMQAVTRALRSGESAPPEAIRVRIWRLGPCAGDCGWGHFLVEKRTAGSDSPGATAEPEYLVELFVYQEQES